MFEEIGTMLSSLISSLTQEVRGTRIEPRTDTIAIPYPETGPVTLTLEMGVGRLSLSPGGDLLVAGAVTYNVEEWQPEIRTEGSLVTMKQPNMWQGWPGSGTLRNEWSLNLGMDWPYELHVEKAVAQSTTLALGGLPLTALTVESGVGEMSLDFASPNPREAERVRLHTGAGRLEATQLLNLNAPLYVIESGAGDLRLDFSGQVPTRTVNVQVSCGAGEVKLNVPPDLPVRVTVTHGLGHVTPMGDFRATAPYIYETTGDPTMPRINVDIKTGVGGVVLTTAGAVLSGAR